MTIAQEMRDEAQRLQSVDRSASSETVYLFMGLANIVERKFSKIEQQIHNITTKMDQE